MSGHPTWKDIRTGILIGILGVIASWGDWRSVIGFGLSFAVFGGLVAAVLQDLASLKESITKLESNGAVPIPLAAKSFHDALGKVKSGDSVARIASLFIAEKLERDFESISKSKLTYREPGGISTVLEPLIPKCEERIFFSFDFTPAEWVDEVYRKECVRLCGASCEAAPKPPKDCNLLAMIVNNQLELPPHLRWLAGCRVKTPIRRVTRLWLDKPTCHMFVLALCSERAGVETRFKVNSAPRGKREKDENILDGVVVREVEVGGHECELVLDRKEADNLTKAWESVDAQEPRWWRDAREWAKRGASLDGIRNL